MKGSSSIDLTSFVNQDFDDSQKLLWDIGMREIYREMKKIAYSVLAKSSASDVSKSPTVLVHETFERLYLKNENKWVDMVHFYATASNVMRFIMIDRIRSSKAKKRDGLKTEFNDDKYDPKSDIESMDYAIETLSKYRSDLGEIVLLKFFGGLNADEIAKIYEIDRKTVQRRLLEAKTHLRKILTA